MNDWRYFDHAWQQEFSETTARATFLTDADGWKTIPSFMFAAMGDGRRCVAQVMYAGGVPVTSFAEALGIAECFCQQEKLTLLALIRIEPPGKVQ